MTDDDPDAVEPEMDGQPFRCPGCDEDLDVPAESVGQLVRCPYCNTEFFAAAGRTHETVVDDTPEPVEVPREAGELTRLRIRQLSAERLAALRTRSWCVIAGLLAGVAAVDLLAATAVAAWRHHAWGVRPTLTAAAAVAAAAVAAAAVRAARRLGRAAARSALVDPADPPDFSQLTADVDPWHRLHDVR